MLAAGIDNSRVTASGQLANVFLAFCRKRPSPLPFFGNYRYTYVRKRILRPYLPINWGHLRHVDRLRVPLGNRYYLL